MKIGFGLEISDYRLSGGALDPATIAHIARVQADGGVVESDVLCNTYFIYKNTNSFMANVLVDAMPHVLGYKEGTGADVGYCNKLYSSPTNGSGDLSETISAVKPLLLKYSSSEGRYIFCTGNSGDYISTPNSSNNQVNNTAEFIWKQNLTSSGSKVRIFGKGVSYAIFKTTSNELSYEDATNNVISTVPLTTQLGIITWYKCTINNTELKFFTSSNGTTWTQLGATLTLTSNITSGTEVLEVGNSPSKIYNLTIAKTIGGVPTVNIDLDSFNALISETSWVSTTGETWAINRAVTNNQFHITVVTRTVIQTAYGKSLETPLNSLPSGGVTQVNIGNILAAPVSAGGNIFRGVLNQTSSNFYRNQLIFNGVEPPQDFIFGSSFSGTSPLIIHGVNILSYKTKFISLRFEPSVIAKAYQNNTFLSDLNASTFSAYDRTMIGGMGGFTVSQDHKGSIVLNTLASESDLFALQSFINTSLFNGEIL